MTGRLLFISAQFLKRHQYLPSIHIQKVGNAYPALKSECSNLLLTSKLTNTCVTEICVREIARIGY